MFTKTLVSNFRYFLICSIVLQLGSNAYAQNSAKSLKKPSLVGRDTLFVSISRNEKVDIKRTIMGNTKKIVGKKVLEFRSYKIEFKNPKKVALALKVQDLIPTSKDGQVELEILESSDAEIDFSRGRLSWKYNVTYPKNRIIIGIENVLQLQANIRKTV
jgi:Domain of unknown function (DUF4139)